MCPSKTSGYESLPGRPSGSMGVRGITGDNAREAFFVTCDQSTMTPEDILHGHLICLVGLALVTPGEFTLYRIHIHQKS